MTMEYSRVSPPENEDNGSHIHSSQHSSINKDVSYLRYNSVPLSEDNISPPERLPQHKTHIFGWWKYELIASVISIAAIMTLALVVRRFEGVPIEDIYLPKSLQLSAIVAALSTVARVSLLVPVASAVSQDSWLWMSNPSQLKNCHSRLKDIEVTDNASRGPFGSLLFLFKARKRYLACFGAVITVLSLGLSTFTQQILAQEVLPIAKGLPTLSNIHRSQTWSTKEGLEDAVVSTLNPAIKAAAYSGLFVPDSQPPNLSCPTGNCTWPVTPSLAVCGDCTKTTFQRTCDPENKVNSCNFTVPSGNVFENGTGIYFNARNSDGGIYNNSDPSRLYLANFDVGGVKNQSLGWTGWNDTGFVSYECGLWVCVQSYSASVQASEQKQSINQTWSDIIGVQNSTNNYLLNYTFGNPTRQPNSLNSTDQYTVAEIAAFMLSSFMQQFFNGTAHAPGSRGISYSDDYIEVIYNATQYAELGSLVKNLASSMSNVFRTAEPAQDDAYNGVASTLSLTVKYQWLAFPAIMVVASLVLSVTNIVRTAKSEVGAWKGSPLATLVSSIDGGVKRQATGVMGQPGGLMRSVGDQKAVLIKDGSGGWIFASM